MAVAVATGQRGVRAARVTRAALALALFAGAAASAACGSKSAKEPQKRPPPLVTVSRVQAQDVPVEVHAPVDLRPLAQADVGSKTLGYLDAVLVDRGDKVKRGQTVAIVRPSDLPDQLAAARGALAQNQASLALARTNSDRAKQLAPSGVISQQELQASEAALASAEAAQTAAQANAAVLATRLGETQITSPLDGVVSVRRLDPGALVTPTSTLPILTVVKLDVLRVFVTVTEREIAGVTVGKDAHVEVDALPGKSFSGKVVRMAPTVDPSTRTLDAEVQIANESGELRPGMYGRGSIVLEVHPHVAVVPVQAIQLTDNKPFVFVLVGTDKVQRRAIATGADLGNALEVTSGLKEGEDVVTAGIDVLSDGMPVRVARDTSPYSGKQAAMQ